MKNTTKKVIALVAVFALAIATIGVFALDYGVPEYASVRTERFFITEDWGTTDDGRFSMISESGNLVIHITDDVIIYFEDFVPMSDDEDTQMTQMVREVLFGRTLAEVLDGRNMRVTYGIVAMSYPAQTTPISVQVLFETAVHLQGEVPETTWFDEESGLWMSWTPVPEYQGEDGYIGIVTLPGDIGDLDLDLDLDLDVEYFDFDWDNYDFGNPELNGEIVVNGEIIYAPAPFWYADTGAPYVLMLPLRAIAEALEYDVVWNDYTQSVMLGVGIHVFIGRNEAYLGRMAPIELALSPFIHDGFTFVPIDFFRNVVNQTVYVFEGQVVVETYTDMF